MKVGRNDPCPCGSGKKYKKCCLPKDAATISYSQIDRNNALAKIEAFTDGKLAEEEEAAYEEFFADFSEDDLDSLESDRLEMSNAAYDMWFFFDYPLEENRYVADLFLEQGWAVTAREREYIRLIKETSVRLYEVEDTVPGVSIALRDVIDNSRITVRERSASRSLSRQSCIAHNPKPPTWIKAKSQSKSEQAAAAEKSVQHYSSQT